MKKIALFLLCIFLSVRIYSNTYYVAKNGNDNANGFENTPWLTIQKAITVVSAGDTVYIKSGTYTERVILETSGLIGNYITLSNYLNDEVIIDGNGIIWDDPINRWNGLVDISGLNYIKIYGLKIINSYFSGIFLENSSNIIIENNTTYNTFSSGIGVWSCNNITIKENEIELACNLGGEECISVSDSFNCQIFQNNVHHNGQGINGGEGIDIKQGSYDINVYQNLVHHLNNRTGIYADAWDSHTYNINIYQNKVYNCTETGIAIASEFGGLLENINIYNNISYNNKFEGIQLGGWTNEDYVGPTPVKHIKIINNTCYNNGSIANSYGFGISIDNAFAEDVILRNNICSENSNQIQVINILSGLVVDHNLIYGDNDNEYAIFGTEFILEDPLFIDASNLDLNLQSNSPAIDFGSSNEAPNFDFNGTNRPIGDGFDIGAYEFNPSAQLENFSQNSINIYPNPFKNELTIDFSNNEKENIEIFVYTSFGKLIYTTKLSKNNFILKRNNLPIGIYLLVITSENQTLATKKIIIK